tara:strand:+ start:20130 stop:21533 length:1404 start_codon:yes stop_codon:yes gene_type:complete
MNESSLDKLVDYYFEPRGASPQPNSLNFGNLLNFIMEEYQKLSPELAEVAKKTVLMEKLEEKIIKFPKIKITERWGEKHNEDREIFEDLMRQVRGNTVQEKIQSVNRFLEYERDLSVSQILSNLMFVEIFSMIIEEFNASTAGFLFEAFLAGLFSGEQIADPEQVGAKAGSLPIEDVTLAIRKKDQPVEEIVPYSLKVLSPTVDLKGSFVNLVDYFASGRQDNIVYLVVTKMGEGTLAFNEFTITQDNFLDYIGHEQYKSFDVLEPVEFVPEDFLEPKVTKKRGEEYIVTKKWMKANNIVDITDLDENPVSGPLEKGQTYMAQRKTGERELRPVGGLTANSKKLYGTEEVYNDLLSKKDSGEEFWDALKDTKGYLTNQQFHISPGNVRGRSENLGELDLYPPRLIKVANHYAVDLGRGLVDLYNALSDLSININKYFIGSDKLAGADAVRNAGTIKSEADKLIQAEE